MSAGRKPAVKTPLLLERLEGSHPNRADEAPAGKKDGESWLQQEAPTECAAPTLPVGKDTGEPTEGLPVPHAETLTGDKP